MLEDSLEQPSETRLHLWRGIQNAYRRLGPEASSAAFKILSLIHSTPEKFLDSWENTVGWLVTLWLIGVVEKDLQPELRGRSATSAAQVMKAVEEKVREFHKNENEAE